MAKQTPSSCHFGQIHSTRELGKLIRLFRKEQNLTLEKVSGLTNVSMRFLSELERGKETAELGKTLATLNKLGLEIYILPRGSTLMPPRTFKEKQNSSKENES